MIERSCDFCGRPFAVIPSLVKHGRGRHCSPGCQYAARRARKNRQIECACIACGSVFFRCPSQIKDKRGAGKYCSRACRDRHWIGRNTPNYQGGPPAYRGPHWAKIKRAVRKRDGCCVLCGNTKGLHVHHGVPFRLFDEHEQANHPSNLVTLCAVCHRKEEARHKWVKVGASALRFEPGGYAWELARSKGMIR